MKDYMITCPYCFAKFSHTAVHFRMETQFDESELNDEGMTENEVERMPNIAKKAELTNQIKMRKPFLRRDDGKYTKWWSNYGSTSEKSLGLDKKWRGGVHQLPILDPNSEEDQKVLKKFERMDFIELEDKDTLKDDYLIYDEDGMASAVEDIFGHRTMRRVCPKCHNPLPKQYGKNPVKFISVIGVTGAGKTVYISQLLKYISKYAAFLNQAAFFTSDHETSFIEDNKVEMDTALPNPTGEGTFSQPMFYDFVTRKSDSAETNTVVIYDIAGEDCQDAARMTKYADFINYSDGIILLIDPMQLGWIGTRVPGAIKEPQAVLNTIYTATTKSVKELSEKPVAVCISKSDSFEQIIPAGQKDIICVRDEAMGTNIPVFNATDYNILEQQLRESMPLELEQALHNQYKYYNYFAISAIGGPVREEPARTESGEEVRTEEGTVKMNSYPIAPPVPRRIAEPLFWLFYRLGIIKSDVPIRLPEPRKIPEYIEIPAKGVMAKLGFGKPTYRTLTDEEKMSYWYEPGCEARRF